MFSYSLSFDHIGAKELKYLKYWLSSCNFPEKISINFFKICLSSGWFVPRTSIIATLHRHRVRGHRERPPPHRNGNNCRKMVLLTMALLFPTILPKLVKNSIFLLNFHQQFSKISHLIVFFVQTRANFTLGFYIFWKIAENNAFFAIFLRNVLNIFEHSLASGGSPPGPLRCRPA